MNPILQVKTRLDTKIEPQDSEALQMIKDLRSTAFDTGSPSPKNNTRYAQDYKKLGFDSHLDPSLDFQVTPPGILALDCMDHFAKTHQEQFMKVVLENSCRSDNHECPFAKSSIELVRQLADLLGVGKAEDPNCKQYHEMFFKSEHPFEEFFCHCVIQLNKTWRDMRATKEDFNKVFDVVVEQIEGSLNPKEAKEVRPKTFEQFRQNVKSYLDIKVHLKQRLFFQQRQCFTTCFSLLRCDSASLYYYLSVIIRKLKLEVFISANLIDKSVVLRIFFNPISVK